MKAVQIREPVHIGKVVRNALLFKFRDPREGAVSDRALLEAVERLFALLEERRIAYLLVGHIALLQYVESRNTDNIDLIMSRSSLDRLPELHKTGQDGDLIRAAFEGIQIHLLLTSNPLFDEVRRRHATRQRFVEREIPCATPQPPTPRRKHLKAGFRATNTVSVIREALGQKAFRLKSAVNAAVLDAVMVGVSTRIEASGPITDIESLKAAYGKLLTNESFLTATGRATADEEYVRTRINLAVEAMRSVR